ncbi:hypothetical protein DEA98_26615 [Brucella pseudogrignonensis]|nr:hypothetical protein [Brucella pseudogrignonensis]
MIRVVGIIRLQGRQPSAHSFLNDSGNDLKGIWIKTWTFFTAKFQDGLRNRVERQLISMMRF